MFTFPGAVSSFFGNPKGFNDACNALNWKTVTIGTDPTTGAAYNSKGAVWFDFSDGTRRNTYNHVAMVNGFSCSTPNQTWQEAGSVSLEGSTLTPPQPG